MYALSACDAPSRIDYRPHGAGRLPKGHKIELLLDNMIGHELRQIAFAQEPKLGQSDRARLFPDHLNDLLARLDV